MAEEPDRGSLPTCHFSLLRMLSDGQRSTRNLRKSLCRRSAGGLRCASTSCFACRMAAELFRNPGSPLHKLPRRVFQGEPLVRQNEFAIGLASKQLDGNQRFPIRDGSQRSRIQKFSSPLSSPGWCGREQL
jgi:hypothetical protein